MAQGACLCIKRREECMADERDRERGIARETRNRRREINEKKIRSSTCSHICLFLFDLDLLTLRPPAPPDYKARATLSEQCALWLAPSLSSSRCVPHAAECSSTAETAGIELGESPQGGVLEANHCVGREQTDLSLLAPPRARPLSPSELPLLLPGPRLTRLLLVPLLSQTATSKTASFPRLNK